MNSDVFEEVLLNGLQEYFPNNDLKLVSGKNDKSFKHYHIYEVSIYPGKYYDRYNGSNMEELVQELAISILHKKASNDFVKSFAMRVVDWDQVKNNLIIRFASYEEQNILPESLPSIKYLNLKAIFNIEDSDGEIGFASIYVTKEIVDVWKESQPKVEDPMYLYEVAIKNMKEKNPVRIDSITSSITGDEFDLEKEQIFVLSNMDEFYGSSYLLENSVIRDFADKKMANLIILPVSIHHVILIPTNMKNNDDLHKWLNLVNKVNKKVERSDILSKNIYYYEREVNKVNVWEVDD